MTAPTSTVEVKARRLLRDGRVTARAVGPDLVLADVAGDTGDHEVRWSLLTGWSCSCPARPGCSHVLSVQLVTVRPADHQPNVAVQEIAR